VLAQCYVSTDARAVDHAELVEAIGELNGLRAGGYFTEVFCEKSRYLRPGTRASRCNTRRDRGSLPASSLYPIVLTSLLEAADRVDSDDGPADGLLKQWAPRSFLPLSLRVPELLVGPGRSIRADARKAVASIGPVDFAYLDPPYNNIATSPTTTFGRP